MEPNQPPKQHILAASEISLVRGGPFYRAQEAARLIEQDRWNLGRRLTFAIAVGWLPLVLITLLFNPRAVFGLISDYPINARMLIGVPVLLAGQLVMESTFRTVLRHIHDAGLLTPPDTDRLDQALVRILRLRDSVVPELVIVVAAYVHVFQVVQTHLQLARPWALVGAGAGAALVSRRLVLRPGQPIVLPVSSRHQPLEVVSVDDVPFQAVATRLATGPNASRSARRNRLSGNVPLGASFHYFCRIGGDWRDLAGADPATGYAPHGL